MGTTWNVFKKYEISNDEDGDLIIKYLDSDDWDLSYSSAGMLYKALLKFGNIDLPRYDWLNPPENGVLELIEPHLVVEGCKKALKILNKEENPFIPYEESIIKGKDSIIGEYFFDLDELEKGGATNITNEGLVSISIKERVIDNLKDLEKISSEGYYVVTDD